jgi:serine/threonine protein kinase
VQYSAEDKVSKRNFKIHKLLGTGAYGKVFLVEKLDGVDKGQLYAMKVLEKNKVTQKKKTTEHTRTEREVTKTTATTTSILVCTIKYYSCHFYLSYSLRSWKKLSTVRFSLLYTMHSKRKKNFISLWFVRDIYSTQYNG